MSRTAELLRRHRIVTLTGSGGVGKTRLALQTASHLTGEYPDGRWLVDFGSVLESSQVISRLALVLGLALPAAAGVDELIAQLAERTQLLIFDTCEHLVSAIAEVAAAIVRNTTSTTILATSRERLRITGEIVSRVSTLPVPAELPKTPADALAFPAVQLFVERGQVAMPDFAFSAARVEAVVAICRRLEGIPLALELAAARLSSLSLPELRDKLSDRFTTLSVGPRDLAPRQQTLLATIAWSFDLLDAREQAVLKALSAFPATFTLVAGVAVCDSSLHEGAIVDLISALADKSFLTIEAVDQDVHRYLMLDSTREYVHGLRSEREAELDMLRFAQWCASFAEEYDRGRFSVSSDQYQEMVGVEFENLTAALYWALKDISRSVIAGRILAGSRVYWVMINRSDELSQLAGELLTRLPAEQYPSVAARLIFCRYNSVPYAERESGLRFAQALLAKQDDEIGLMICNLYLADCLTQTNAADSSRAVDEAERLATKLCLPWVFLQSAQIKIANLRRAGRFVEAKERNLVLIRQCNELGDLTTAFMATVLLGQIEFGLGKPDRACQITRDALSTARETGVGDQGFGLSCLSQLLAVLGEDEEVLSIARTIFSDSSLQTHNYVMGTILSMSVVAARQGQALNAARLLGFYNAHRIDEEYDGEPGQTCRDMVRASLEETLSEAELKTHLKAGEGLDKAAAIGIAFTVCLRRNAE